MTNKRSYKGGEGQRGSHPPAWRFRRAAGREGRASEPGGEECEGAREKGSANKTDSLMWRASDFFLVGRPTGSIILLRIFCRDDITLVASSPGSGLPAITTTAAAGERENSFDGANC